MTRPAIFFLCLAAFLVIRMLPPCHGAEGGEDKPGARVLITRAGNAEDEQVRYRLASMTLTAGDQVVQRQQIAVGEPRTRVQVVLPSRKLCQLQITRTS